MIKKVKLNYWVLLIFVLFEVLLFEGSNPIQLVVSIIEYLFILIVLFRNTEIGIAYFVSFTLLTLGLETQHSSEAISFNFYSLRFLGFSFNILFSIFLFFYCLGLKSSIRFSFFKNINYMFFCYFIIYSIFLGLLGVAFSYNYLDNYIKDVLTYFPFFIYVYLLSKVSTVVLRKIITYGFSLTCMMMFLSLTIGVTRGGTEYTTFVLSNSFTFMLPLAMLFMKNMYSKVNYTFLWAIIIYTIIIGAFFISAKQIVLVVFLSFWVFLNYRKYIVISTFSIVLFFLFIGVIFQFFIQYYSNSFVGFKFSQIYDAFTTSDISSLAASPTSMGNLIAEGITLYNYLIENPFVLFFGKGFGAGIPDLYGYLGYWSGNSGYAGIDLSRNDFHKLHIPIYEVLLKTGLFGMCFYIYIISKIFINKNKYIVFYLIMLLTIFYANKEYFLLTILFLEAYKPKKLEIKTN